MAHSDDNRHCHSYRESLPMVAFFGSFQGYCDKDLSSTVLFGTDACKRPVPQGVSYDCRLSDQFQADNECLSR